MLLWALGCMAVAAWWVHHYLHEKREGEALGSGCGVVHLSPCRRTECSRNGRHGLSGQERRCERLVSEVSHHQAKFGG